MKRLNNGKGIFDLLEIWKLCCLMNPALKLAIIGDGPSEIVKKIHKFIEKNNLDNNIFLLGVIYDFEKKFRLLNSSKLFILPTHEENWAIVIGEAMAIKLPVLCYNLKEIFPIWKDNVEWIDFEDVSDFADKILAFLNSREKRVALSNKAFDFIKKYDWQEIVKNEFND
jgi:glycosyltransferase involved in cell wall biosynthesis